MSTITTPLPVGIPSFPIDERGVVCDVSWNFYERMSDAIGDNASIRVAYDGKDLEITAPGPKHEDIKDLLGVFVYEVCLALRTNFQPYNSTTWKRAELQRAVEADQCYYFDPAKLATASASTSNDVADYPNPDLAIEVDLSPSKIDRPGIYSALGVAEVWRFDPGATEPVSIEQLGPDGTYAPAAVSRFLTVQPDDIARWVADGLKADRLDWIARLRKWVRDELGRRAEARD